MSFTFAPRGWATCDGRLLAINQNQALFSILGTTYGGNGQTTFALPDLRGRLPVDWDGSAYQLGQRAGTEAIVLSPSEVPPHTHTLNASRTAGDDTFPGLLASAANLYGQPTNLTQIGAAAPNGPSISPAGSAPHANVMPYLVLNFCIALAGIFPSRT
jgi:microcystin-dependent protein